MAKTRSLRLADFSIEPPDHWVAELIAQGPVDGGFRPNLVTVAMEVPASETAETFAARVLPQVRTAAPDYKVVKEGVATFGSVKGFLREHTFSQAGKKIGQLQLYVVGDGLARTFTFSHLASKLAGARRSAELMFASIRLYSSGAAADRLKLTSMRG